MSDSAVEDVEQAAFRLAAENRSLRAENELLRALVRGLYHFADGHELRGKFLDELRSLKKEAEPFIKPTPEAIRKRIAALAARPPERGETHG